MNHWYCDTIDEGIRYEYDLTHQAPTQVHDEDCFLSACDNLFKIIMISFEEEEMQDLQVLSEEKKPLCSNQSLSSDKRLVVFQISLLI